MIFLIMIHFGQILIKTEEGSIIKTIKVKCKLWKWKIN